MAKLAVYLLALLLAVASIQAELYRFKKGNQELEHALNSAINELVTKGELDKLYEIFIGGPNVRIEDCSDFLQPYFTSRIPFPAPTEDGTLSQILKRKVIRVGFWDFAESWLLTCNTVGNPEAGFLYTLTHKVVDYLSAAYNVDLQIEWVRSANFYPDLLEGLNRADYDVVVSQMSKSAKWGDVPRQELVSFTCSYASDAPAFAISSALKGNNIQWIYNLNNPGYSLAVVKGSSYAQYAVENLFLAQVFEYDTVFEATWAVHRNERSAVLDDSTALLRAVKQYPHALYMGNYGVAEGQGFAVRNDENCDVACPNGPGSPTNLVNDCRGCGLCEEESH